KSNRGEARFQRLDVSSEADWEAAVAAALAAYGKIDILINNAGVSGSDPDRLSIATWDRQMSINAKGVFLGMRAVIPVMQKAKSGSIVNISSISGVVGQTFVHMGYNAAKGAVRTMTKAAAVQFARDGIRVNSVHPGLMPAMRTSVLSADPSVRAGMLRIYNTSQPPSASIHEESTIATHMPFMAVFNNLVRFDASKPRNGFDTIVPDLAESWAWDTSGTKLTFKLRTGVAWHDGKP